MNEYEYNKSYDLKLVNGILYDYTFSTYDHRESINLINFENNEKPQSDDYFVKLPATFKSFRGEIHVAFSEYPQTENSNRVYEFGEFWYVWTIDFFLFFFSTKFLVATVTLCSRYEEKIIFMKSETLMAIDLLTIACQPNVNST